MLVLIIYPDLIFLCYRSVAAGATCQVDNNDNSMVGSGWSDDEAPRPKRQKVSLNDEVTFTLVHFGK